MCGCVCVCARGVVFVVIVCCSGGGVVCPVQCGVWYGGYGVCLVECSMCECVRHNVCGVV